MGLFKRNKKEPKKVEQTWTNNQENGVGEYNYKSINKGYLIKILGAKAIKNIQYRNGERTKLMLAKAIKLREDDTFMFNEVKDIAFELNERQLPSYDVLKAVAHQYEIQERTESEGCQYLGIVDSTENGYEITRYSHGVENYIKQQIDPMIIAQKEQERRELNARYKQKQLNERRSLYMESLKAEDYMNARKREYAQRKANPYLYKKDQYVLDGKIYEDYNGINLQTGEILRMRHLDKVMKTKDTGIYLYQGNIYSTPNEHDADLLEGEKPGEVPVCFELPKRLSDIVNEQNPEQIRSVLELLSSARNYSRNEGLVYLGEIDKNWAVNFRPESTHFRKRVKELKARYYQENGNKNLGQNYGE